MSQPDGLCAGPNSPREDWLGGAPLSEIRRISIVKEGGLAMADKKVTITVNQGVITAIPDIVELSKASSDKVAWEADEEFEIKFNRNECPFGSDTYKSSGHKAKSEESAVKPREKPYKYKVRLVASGKESDPGVVIRP
jgi:hypothetical protein